MTLPHHPGAGVPPSAPRGDLSTRAIVRRLRLVASQRAEELLAEVPATIRRLRTLLLVLSISVPVFLTAIVVVLWRLASRGAERAACGACSSPSAPWRAASASQD